MQQFVGDFYGYGYWGMDKTEILKDALARVAADVAANVDSSGKCDIHLHIDAEQIIIVGGDLLQTDHSPSPPTGNAAS